MINLSNIAEKLDQDSQEELDEIIELLRQKSATLANDYEEIILEKNPNSISR